MAKARHLKQYLNIKWCKVILKRFNTNCAFYKLTNILGFSYKFLKL